MQRGRKYNPETETQEQTQNVHRSERTKSHIKSHITPMEESDTAKERQRKSQVQHLRVGRKERG